MRYVALEDVTVHKKDGDEVPEGEERWGTFSAVTLTPGESIGEKELASHQVKLYDDGKLDHLLQKVNDKVADEIQKLLDSGDSFDVKMIKDVVLAEQRGGARRKQATESKESE